MAALGADAASPGAGRFCATHATATPTGTPALTTATVPTSSHGPYLLPMAKN